MRTTSVVPESVSVTVPVARDRFDGTAFPPSSVPIQVCAPEVRENPSRAVARRK
jgi:hypothetical protein